MRFPAGGNRPRKLMMLTTRILTAALAATLCTAPAAASDRDMSGEARLGRALAGKAEGQPVDCLTLRQVRSSRIVDSTAVIFETPGTLYVNRPVAGAESLSDSKALLFITSSFEICGGEAVRLIDPSSRMDSGLVFLGRFVPYRKAKRR
jgi:hypothetical protein